VPVVYLQALAAGTPVLAWRGSSAADDVLDGRTGQVVDDWSELPEALARVEEGWDGYAAAAHARFEALYTADRWVEGAEALYARVIAARGRVPEAIGASR
jgi:glycosyltransferase involved in cell wall biosynthesis